MWGWDRSVCFWSSDVPPPWCSLPSESLSLRASLGVLRCLIFLRHQAFTEVWLFSRSVFLVIWCPQIPPNGLLLVQPVTSYSTELGTEAWQLDWILLSRSDWIIVHICGIGYNSCEFSRRCHWFYFPSNVSHLVGVIFQPKPTGFWLGMI